MFQATAEGLSEPSKCPITGDLEPHMFRSTEKRGFAGRTEHVMFQMPPGPPRRERPEPPGRPSAGAVGE